MSPQGWLGNAISQFGQPLGNVLGGALGNQGMGNTIGGIASQLGRYLPFNADLSALYQQYQQSPQAAYGGFQSGQSANSYAGQQPVTLH